MTTSMSLIKKLIRKGSRSNSFARRKPGSANDCDKDKTRCRSKDGQGCKARRTQIKDLPHNHERQSVVISKKDNEAFGFKIKTYEENITDSGHGILTRVSSVRDEGPAERAGLRTGDVIISIGGVWVEGFVHQHIVDLIQNSSSHLKMEIVRGTTAKQMELQKKLHHLQEQLREKREELQILISHEEHLRRGDQSSRCSRSCFPPEHHLSIPSERYRPLPVQAQ